MIVLIANDLAPAVRGKLKLWFIEPKPNVFISGIKDSLAEKVIEYLMNQKIGAGSILFSTSKYPPWYKFHTFGSPVKPLKNLDGLQLVVTSERNGK